MGKGWTSETAGKVSTMAFKNAAPLHHNENTTFDDNIGVSTTRLDSGGTSQHEKQLDYPEYTTTTANVV